MRRETRYEGVGADPSFGCGADAGPISSLLWDAEKWGNPRILYCGYLHNFLLGVLTLTRCVALRTESADKVCPVIVMSMAESHTSAALWDALCFGGGVPF